MIEEVRAIGDGEISRGVRRLIDFWRLHHPKFST